MSQNQNQRFFESNFVVFELFFQVMESTQLKQVDKEQVSGLVNTQMNSDFGESGCFSLKINTHQFVCQFEAYIFVDQLQPPQQLNVKECEGLESGRQRAVFA